MNESTYHISLKLGSRILEGTGATALEALRAIPRPDKITEKGVFTIMHGEKRKEMVFMPVRLRRLFYPNAQPILVKWLALGL